MLCAFSMARIVVVPLVAPGVTGTVAATFPSTRTWMLAMAAVGLPGRDQVTGKLAGTAVPLAGAVRVAAVGAGAAGGAGGRGVGEAGDPGGGGGRRPRGGGPAGRGGGRERRHGEVWG